MRSREPFVDRRDPETPPEPELEIQVIPEDPEEIAVRERTHERIQTEIHHENKVETTVEEMLEVPQEWNEVSDLMMEDEDVGPATEGAAKGKIDEEARGWRKRWKEVYIRLEKHAPLPTVSRRTQNPEGFYSKDWNEVQQEEDEWQMSDKWQRITQMVFHGGCLEINPVKYGSISSSCTQHM